MTKTRFICLLAALCAPLLAGAVTSHAVSEMKMVTIGGDDADATAMIPELGALILEKDSTLTVQFVMAPEQRLKQYREVDLKQDDVILMVNGKRTRIASELTAILDSLAAGDEVKIGTRRDKKMQIVSFAKAAPEDLPQVKMITKTISPEEGAAEGEGGPKMKMVTRTEGGTESKPEIVILSGSGLVARQDSNSVVVLAVLPGAKEALGDAEVHGGDRIVRLREKEIADLGVLATEFEAVAIGDTVTVVLARKDHQYSVSFAKTKPSENVMIKSR